MKQKIFTTILFILLFVLQTPKVVIADTIFPHKKEIVLSQLEKVLEEVSFKNDSKKDIYFTPKIYSYNPQNQEISYKQSYIFLRTDEEQFKVKPEETVTVKYEIIPTQNIEPGTYFNVIVFQKGIENSFLEQTIPVGVMDSLSHLVVLHITEGSSAVQGITTNFAQINIEIIEQGIPYIKPTRIKYVYQNTTNYVLSPEGEIQIYNNKGSYPPIYLRINEKKEKLYPGGILEEEFYVEKYDLTDVLHKRNIVGRFYNGIDENFITKKIEQDPNYLFLSLFGIGILFFFFLVKAIFKDRKS